MIQEQISKELLKEDSFSEIIGQEATKYQLKSALLAGRHALIIGNPGIGKTTLAKSVAKLLPTIKLEKDPITGKKINSEKKGIDRFIRIQGSPDLTVEDLFGDIDPIKTL